MKNFVVSPEIAGKVKAIVTELHELCAENRIPFLACVVLSNDGITTTRALSALINSEEDLVDNSLIAAAEILRMTNIPNPVVHALIAMNEGREEQRH